MFQFVKKISQVDFYPFQRKNQIVVQAMEFYFGFWLICWFIIRFFVTLVFLESQAMFFILGFQNN
jgi:hypothetical protein